MTFTVPEDSGLEGAYAGALGSQAAFATADEAETLENLERARRRSAST